MKHTQEEILKALRVIKDECGEHMVCKVSCPFNLNGDCGVNTCLPVYWEINDDSVTHWKGLL